MNLFFGKLQQRNNDFIISDNPNSFYETEEYLVSVYGDIIINEKKNDYPAILEYFSRYQNDIVNHMEGLYYLFLYAKKEKQLYIYQDYYTSSEILYYTQLKDTIYFSNHLQTLLIRSNISRTLNQKNCSDFIKYGYVPGAETLLTHVYKIAPFHMLTIHDGKISTQKIPYYFTTKSEKDGKQLWVSSLNRAIALNTPSNNTISLPISGGFDSNYLLYYYNKNLKKKLHLFTVGGNTGIDETENVRKIVKSYGKEQNRLTICYTSKDMLINLPDIIWRLGGSVYERGIFLQYKLASELALSHVQDLVCGECADQVMHEDFYHTDSQHIPLKGKKNPYDFAAYIILKKSGIMLNSFGIKGHYPYLNQHFVETAISVKALNNKTKAFHQQTCHELFPKNISKNIHKNGGATFIHTLFQNDTEIESFIKTIEGSVLYKTIQNSKSPEKKANFISQGKRILLKFKHAPQKLIAKIRVQKLNTLTPKYIKTEKRLRKDMVYLYLLVFEELFCFSRFDYYLTHGVESLNIYEFIHQIPQSDKS